MADTPDTGAPAEGPVRGTSRNRWVLIGAVVAVLAVGGIVGVVLALDDDDTPDDAASQIGWMRDACQQWAEAEGTSGPDDDWCDSMARWMNGRMGDGSMVDRRQMRGPMMWQNPTSMAATCKQWMAATSDGVPEGADASAWCEQMTAWMAQNMGDWDSWMTDGPP